MRIPLWSAGVGLLAAVLGVTAPTAAASASPLAVRTTAHTAAPAKAHAKAHRDPLDWETYFVQNRYSGRCVDEPDGNTTPGIQLQQYSCNGTPAQQWTFGQVNGYWEVLNSQGAQDDCLQDQGAWVGSGVPALQWYCEVGLGMPWTDEQWTLVPVPGLWSTYYIQNVANDNRCLGVPNWGVSNGDLLRVLNCDWGADQQWILQDTGYKHRVVSKPQGHGQAG